MQTDSHDYEVFLEHKYHPLRGVYLNRIVYPRYVREFIPGPIYDFGCGMGAFLEYCRLHNIPACGIDSNPHMVRRCQEKGLNAQVDDIVRPAKIVAPIRNIICDNVLEHLSAELIDRFFDTTRSLLSSGGVLLVVTPNHRGYHSDPTHKTEVNEHFVESTASKHGFILNRWYRHPIQPVWLSESFVYNMNVFRLVGASGV